MEDFRKDDSYYIRVLEVGCWNHLRKVWVGGMTNALSTIYGNTTREELDEINLRLGFSKIIKSVLIAVNKEFSLCDSYPKGREELFRDWIETYHPGVLIFLIERSSGSRQDLSIEGSGLVYMNLPYWIAFLDKGPRMPRDNILQENIIIIRSSLVMKALARLCDIIHITICLPTFWL